MSSDQPSETDSPKSAETTGQDKKPPKKKFKYTRELVRIAIDAGMTQKEIATRCRVQQSIVSKWANGESRGTEQQLAPLLKLYGSRLSRTTARVYLAMADPDPRWENTAMGREFLAVLLPAADEWDKGNQGDGPEYQKLSSVVRNLAERMELEVAGSLNWEHLLDAIQVLFASDYSKKLVEVDGPVIFRHTFNRLDGRYQRAGIEPVRLPVARWALHDGLRGRFVLVRQYRRHLPPEHLQIWQQQKERQEAVVLAAQQDRSFGARQEFLPMLKSGWIDSADDAARWVCRVEHPMALEELLAFVDGYVQDWLQLHSVHDCHNLPFLLRKALVERRYSVPGVDRITDYE